MMSEFQRAADAAKAGDLATVQAIVAANPSILTERDDEGHALLDVATWALLVGDWSKPPTIAPDVDGTRMAIVRALLDAGSDPNGAGHHGWTPLHTALYENQVELTEELLRRGADPTTEVKGAGGTPLVQALFWGHTAAADALAAHSIEPRNLRVAVGLGRADLMAAMFDGDGHLVPAAFAGRGFYRPHEDFPEGTLTDAPQEVLDEALTYAVRNGRAAVLDELLARGASVDAAPYAGGGLHWAAATGRTEIARWLLDHGADVNLRATFGSQLGCTPLHTCAWIDNVEIASLLVERGADITARDESHDSPPLGWAEFLGSPNVAALLRERG